jgi:hypothetical protein
MPHIFFEKDRKARKILGRPQGPKARFIIFSSGEQRYKTPAMPHKFSSKKDRKRKKKAWDGKGKNPLPTARFTKIVFSSGEQEYKIPLQCPTNSSKKIEK